jgi:tetratricopeptide (TPR) repeat protein
MYRHSTRIQRNYNKPFFSKRRATWRIYFVGFISALIITIPLVVMAQFQPIQLATLDVIGMAPTATPFASDYAQQAQELFLKGDIAGAERYYRLAVQLQPENINYLYEYGKVLLEQNRYPEAEELGKRAIEIAPDDPRGYALTANALVWTDAASAIPYAISGIEVRSDYAPLNSALAIAYTNIGRYQEALQRGDLATRIDPMDANARRAFSYPLIYTGQYNLAVEQLEQAIAINPNITSPYFELASLYRRLNQDEMAVAIFERLIELDPNNAKAYLRKCETYAAAGLFQEGEPYCEKALDLDPQYADAYRMQGQLRYSRRNYEGSIESFNTCISLGSDAIECYYIRGLAHYFLGQCDLAWDVLNESLTRVNPDLTPVVNSIKIGLENVTRNCDGYQGQPLPTQIPPTPIPPTPIGGL